MISYSFQKPDKSYQLQYLHPKVLEIFEAICKALNANDYDVEITSMVRPVGTVKGESGVHATGRALDCVPRGKKVDDDFMNNLENTINVNYPRKDGRLTCLWHSVKGGGGYHFHIQVPRDDKYTDLEGFVPQGGKDVPKS
jgi:hypothetical protein